MINKRLTGPREIPRRQSLLARERLPLSSSGRFDGPALLRLFLPIPDCENILAQIAMKSKRKCTARDRIKNEKAKALVLSPFLFAQVHPVRGCYMFPTIAFPNSEHFTSLAPSMSRAKS
jgi:hypothetical protein